MDALFTQNLPQGMHEIFKAPPGTSLEDLARRAVSQLGTISDDVTRSKVSHYVLNFFRGRSSDGQKEVVERALQVMEKFPHYPRPRAEVARRALEMLASA